MRCTRLGLDLMFVACYLPDFDHEQYEAVHRLNGNGRFFIPRSGLTDDIGRCCWENTSRTKNQEEGTMSKRAMPITANAVQETL
jgi:hypothetical protein